MTRRRTDARFIRVFVGSPGDVAAERNIISEVVAEINGWISKMLPARLECLRWEEHVAPLMGRPEQVILDQLSLADWDVFVGILWTRFGSPSGATDPTSGKAFLSGTEEEFRLAYRLWRATGRPQIMFYSCQRPPMALNEIDPRQLGLVKAFFEEFAANGDMPGLVKSYIDLDTFRSRFRQDLIYVLRQIIPYEKVLEGANLSDEHKQSGFEKLYVQSQNAARNEAKKLALAEASDIRLVAHSGYSYLALHGHRFRDELEARVSSGAVFRALILNPWSVAGLRLALAQLHGNRGAWYTLEGSSEGNINVVDVVRGSTPYRLSFQNVIEGYKYIKKRYNDNVQIRLTFGELPATVLLTERECFFEPYIPVQFEERLDRAMVSFDLHCTADAYLYRYMSTWFDAGWECGLDIEQFLADEGKFVTDFCNMLRIERDEI